MSDYVKTTEIPVLDYSGTFLNKQELTEDDWATILTQSEPFQLDLAYTLTTDADLVKLERCSNLTLLCLVECGNLTPGGIDRLKTALPKCRMMTSPPVTRDWRRIVTAIFITCLGAAAVAWFLYDLKREQGEKVPPADPEVCLIVDKADKPSDPALNVLENTPRLTSIFYYAQMRINQEGFKRILAHERLETLVLQTHAIRKDELAKLPKLKNLKRLSINASRLNDDGFALLAEMTGLTDLVVENAPNLTDDAMAVLKKLPNLENLGLISCPKLGVRTVQTLVECPRINTLTINYCTLIDDDAMQTLAGMQKLKRIALGKMNLTARGIGVLPKIPNLERVSLDGEFIKDDLLTPLSLMPRLVECSVMNTLDVGDIGIRHITRHKELKILFLGALLGVSDAALAPLEESAISNVTLVGCVGLGDPGLLFLPKTVSQLTLGSSNFDLFTSRGIRAFKRAHPRCEIRRLPKDAPAPRDR